MFEFLHYDNFHFSVKLHILLNAWCIKLKSSGQNMGKLGIDESFCNVHTKFLGLGNMTLNFKAENQKKEANFEPLFKIGIGKEYRKKDCGLRTP